MTSIIRIIVIIGACLLGIMILGLFKAGTGQSNSQGVGGPIGLIIAFALFAGIRAIWNYKPDNKKKEDSNDDDKHQLDKK